MRVRRSLYNMLKIGARILLTVRTVWVFFSYQPSQCRSSLCSAFGRAGSSSSLVMGQRIQRQERCMGVAIAAPEIDAEELTDCAVDRLAESPTAVGVL